MKLYVVNFDGQHDYVEAEDFRDAIDVWKTHAKTVEAFEGCDQVEDPESVQEVNDGPALRREP